MDAETEILRGKRKGTPVGSLVPYTRAGTPTAQGLTHQQLFWDPQERRGNREPLPPRLGDHQRGTERNSPDQTRAQSTPGPRAARKTRPQLEEFAGSPSRRGPLVLEINHHELDQ